MKFLIRISNLICLGFIYGVGNYWFRYFTDIENRIRKEYLIGVALCLTWAFIPSIFSFFGSIIKRDSLGKIEITVSRSFLPLIIIIYIIFQTMGT